MSEDDVRAIYWLLKRIYDDPILRDYFANDEDQPSNYSSTCKWSLGCPTVIKKCIVSY